MSRRKPRRTILQRSALLNDLHDRGVNLDNREIHLMSEPTNATDGLDWCAANTFLKNLSLLTSFNHEPILVHQCTCGGDWNYGMAIYDAILTCPSPVVLIAHAHARSMSSIIPQAAKRRIIMPNADFMIHFGVAGFDGDSRSFVAEGKWIDQIDERMIEIYAGRCVHGPFFRRNRYSRERVKNWLREGMNKHREWYMTATETVNYGFMDGVFGSPGFRTIAECMKL